MDDPDATVRRPVQPGPHARRPPREQGAPRHPHGEPDQREERDATTVVRPRSAVEGRHDVNGEGRRDRSDDSDATVIRNTVVQPYRADATARTLPQGSTQRPLPKRALALPRGLRLHEYRIERVLGQGGFGITYLATDANLDAKVAIKEYLPEEIAFRASDRSVLPNASLHRDRYQQGLENFLAEARTLASFRHPNIVRVARFFEAHRTAYMVLEYERGASFKKWWLKQDLQRHGGQGERLLVERLQPLLDGLSTVHAAGFLHRDIKPDNIQVRAEDGRLVLLDFGSAGQTVALADQDAVVVTPGYAPLEQYGIGEQGAWTDLYALAATLYWAVAGRKPPDAEARAAGILLPPAVDMGKGRFGRNFLEAIDWALMPDPAARPRSVEAWRTRLLADHVNSLGLQEALQRDDSQLDDDAAPAQPRARWRARLRSRWRRWAAPSAWPLAAKLAVVLVATALLPMLLTGLYNLGGAERALQQSQLQSTEQLAQSTAGHVGQLLADSARLAAGLGGDAALTALLAPAPAAEPPHAGPPNAGPPMVSPPLVGPPVPADAALAPVQQRLDALARANPDIHFVMVMDAGGSVRVSTDRELLGRNFAFRDYFKAAMAGRAASTGIIVGAAAGAAGVFFAEPVREPGGPVLGAVVLRLRAAAIAAILDRARHGGALTPFLVDADGVVVQHPRPELMFRSLVPLPAAVQARIHDDQRFRRDRVDSLDEDQLAAALAGAGGGGRSGHLAYRARSSGSDEVAGFAPVPGHGWTLVVSQPRERFEQPVARLWTHLYWSLALAGLLFAGLALRFARSIVRPLRALTAGTQALKAGQFEQAYVEARSRDELGQLARTFNVMVDVLRQRERERSTRR